MARTTLAGGKTILAQSPVPMRHLPDHMIASGEPVASIERIARAVGLAKRSLHSGLQRLRDAGRLFSPARGLYVAVPPEYRSWGVVPADWFIDPMMRHLGRRYYVALLTAATMHAAGTQSPQVFQVMVDRQLADRDLGRVRLRFHVSALLAHSAIEDSLERRTTHTGSMRVSGPELTALDLITHISHAGGLDNVATILTDLGLDSHRLADVAALYPRVAARRLGWLLERHADGINLDPLRAVAVPTEGESMPLDPHAPAVGIRDQRWGLIVNSDVEADR